MDGQWSSTVHRGWNPGARNMKPSSRRLIVQWVITAWSKLSKEIMVNSFKVCALNTAVDGSEDSKIHCFKKGETCEAGTEQLKMQLTFQTLLWKSMILMKQTK